MLHKIPRWVLVGCVLLASIAGYVNSIAMLSFTHTGVSHVTGTVTLAGSELLSGDWPLFVQGVLTVLAFLCGSVLCGVVVGSEALSFGQRYGWAMLIEASLLALAYTFFKDDDMFGELCASMACGLQNAMVATYSGSIIRTTHLTGIITDIGSSLGNWLARRPVQWPSVVLQSSIAASFFVGAILGAAGFFALSYQAVLVPSAVLGVLGLVYMVYRVVLGR